MKGCEIQCGNRFHYLLIWPCWTVSCQSRRHWAAVCMCAHLTHFTHWSTKNRQPGFKPEKFMQISAMLWTEYIKAVWCRYEGLKTTENKSGMSGYCCSEGKGTTVEAWATCKIQRSNAWFSFPQQQTRLWYSYNNVNAVFQKEGGEKGWAKKPWVLR